MEKIEFWQSIYITAIKCGHGRNYANELANQAIKDMESSFCQIGSVTKVIPDINYDEKSLEELASLASDKFGYNLPDYLELTIHNNGEYKLGEVVYGDEDHPCHDYVKQILVNFLKENK